MPARRAVVSGRVQGVGFRFHVLQLAQGLGITGEVWNRLDGSVECVFAHDDSEVLSQFEAYLWKGPGRVDGVLSASHPTEALGEDFRVGRTRP